jgi:very-short-patch-repair endonuclease
MRPYYGSRPKREFARKLRQHATPAEQQVWQIVRGRKLFGLKFRRQHPVAGFLTDFCCEQIKLVIEVDGSIHNLKSQQAADRERAAAIARKGYSILRINNEDVSRERLKELVRKFVKR